MAGRLYTEDEVLRIADAYNAVGMHMALGKSFDPRDGVREYLKSNNFHEMPASVRKVVVESFNTILTGAHPHANN